LASYCCSDFSLLSTTTATTTERDVERERIKQQQTQVYIFNQCCASNKSYKDLLWYIHGRRSKEVFYVLCSNKEHWVDHLRSTCRADEGGSGRRSGRFSTSIGSLQPQPGISILNKMGYHHNLPYCMVFAPQSYGRVGMSNLKHKMETQQLIILLHHLQA